MGVRIVVCVSARVSGAGSCDVYRTVFCPTLSSLSVRTYSAESPPPPHQLLYCVEYLY